jgi:ABC-type nitrate/sulfonate/bicarbonate transport system permease component
MTDKPFPWQREDLPPARRWGLGICGLVAFLGLWQLLGWLGWLGATPSPAAVARAVARLAGQGDPFMRRSLWSHVGASLFRILCGFALAAAAGTGMGLLMGWNAVLRHLFRPLVEMLRPVPPIAWVVLAILWFGIGNAPAVFIVFLGALFPVLLNMVSGLESFDPVLGEAAVTLGASRAQVLFRVAFPSALPQFFTGLRVGLGVAWMSLIAAEMVGVGTSGLGLMIESSKTMWRLDYAVAGMVVIGAVGLALDFAMRRVETYFLRWR